MAALLRLRGALPSVVNAGSGLYLHNAGREVAKADVAQQGPRLVLSAHIIMSNPLATRDISDFGHERAHNHGCKLIPK